MEVVFDNPTCPNKDCPEYGKDNRLVQGMVDAEIKISRMPPGTKGNTRINNYTPTIGGLPKPGQRLVSSQVTYDICTKCGMEYAVKIEVGHLIMSVLQGQPAKFE